MSYSPRIRTGKRLGRPRNNACETCRSAKVKCDEHQPRCSRCFRLQLQCSWPLEPIVPSSRVGVGKRRILPKLSASPPSNSDGLGQSPDSHIEIGSPERNHDSINKAINALVTSVDTRLDAGSDADDPSPPFGQNTLCGSDLSAPSLDFAGLLSSSSLFIHDILLDDSLVLSGDEYQALNHYQHGFISNQLFKTPRWSTFECILQSVSHIPMTMHFLIAISSLDLVRRSPQPAISINMSRVHFRKGSEMLIHLMNLDTEPHHFSTLSSWFFLYLCMTHRDTLDRDAVNQLSTAILNYVQRYNLDTLSAGAITGDQPLAPPGRHGFSYAEPGLIGRMLLFLSSADSMAGFQGCGGHLARYLYSNEERYWRIFSGQRFVLERFWGASYPDCEMVNDLEMSTGLEMGYRVALLIHRVNELSEKSSEDIRSGAADLEMEIARVESDYSPILRMTRLTAGATSPFLRTADAVVSGFYFTQIYYFRLSLGSSSEPAPPHIVTAMSDMMNIAHRTFSQQEPLGHWHFQLPLFIVGIETNDRIHVEWIMTKLTKHRLRNAMRNIISIQQRNGTRLSIFRIREILRAPSGHEVMMS